jgi:hypothetical protein
MPDPQKPSEPPPDEEEHGGELAKTLREIENEQPLTKPEDTGSKGQT